MARRLLLAATGAIALAAAGLGTATAQAAAPSAAADANIHTVHSCATPTKGHAGCFAVVRDDAAASAAMARMASGAKGGVNPNATPSGYGPSDIRAAYNLVSSNSGGRTVAIVDAYDDPTAEADLATYRKQFGLTECSTANGCFKKVNQTGGTRYPSRNGGWAQEISLDLDMVSATCPDCHILLVEASSASFGNLGTAVNTAAATPGVVAISNSYGGSDASDGTYGHYYDHPGKAVTVSSGDGGYGVEYPASSQYVTAVGGTHLVADGSTRGWTETAWSGAGSGCSTQNPQPSWQTKVANIANTCGKRAVADVSAVADPNTGVAVYDSTAYQGMSGWMVFGGTSVASPIIASVYALGGNLSGIPAQYTYSHAPSLYDVTSGSNGSCGGTPLCTSGTGWDGPTGLGTPNGVGAF